ncbi:MAG: hypothetical protein L0Z53_01985, partial [Acidobacteriales bacterium]|nr:hypothetical protein [Terriglobales bacterium]
GAVSAGKIMPKPGGQIPQGLPDMIVQSLTAIRDSSGVNLETLGMVDREQAGVLEYQRKQAAMTVLAGLFDSLRRYRKEQGRVLLYFIQRYLTDGRLIRIVGQEKSRYVPLTKDEAVSKYDVIVDQQATSPNQKEATWAIIGNLMPTLLKLPLPPEIWIELVKYSPLPQSFAERVRASIANAQASPPQPSPEMLKLQLDKQKQDQQLAHDQQKNVMQIQTEQAKAAARIVNEREEHAARLAMERDKLAAQIAMEREKMLADIALERERAADMAGIAAMQERRKAQTSLAGASATATRSDRRGVRPDRRERYT